jgi:hypothetical protein
MTQKMASRYFHCTRTGHFPGFLAPINTMKNKNHYQKQHPVEQK